MDTVTLASGRKMPLVGFGLWKVPADKAADIVYNVSRYTSLIQRLSTEDLVGHQSWLPPV